MKALILLFALCAFAMTLGASNHANNPKDTITISDTFDRFCTDDSFDNSWQYQLIGDRPGGIESCNGTTGEFSNSNKSLEGALLPGNYSDVTDITAKFEWLQNPNGGEFTVGFFLRANASNGDFYFAEMVNRATRAQIQLEKENWVCGHDCAVLLAQGPALPGIPGTVQPNTWYDIRASLVGGTFSAKVWKDGTPEPTNWIVSKTDNNPLPSGQVGITATDSVNATSNILVSDFSMTGIAG